MRGSLEFYLIVIIQISRPYYRQGILIFFELKEDTNTTAPEVVGGHLDALIILDAKVHVAREVLGDEFRACNTRL